MRYQTHVVSSVAGAMLLNQTFDVPFSVGILAGVVVGSLLPDVDEPQSYIGRRTGAIADTTKGMFGHRGLTHSIVGTIAFALLAMLLVVPFHVIETYMEASMWQTVLVSGLFALLFGVCLRIVGDILAKFGFKIAFLKKTKKVFFGLFIVSLLTGPSVLMVFLKEILFGLVIGYSLHIIGDMFSKSGVPLFKPFSDIKIKIYLYKTGGKREMMIRFACIAAIIYLFATGDFFSQLF